MSIDMKFVELTADVLRIFFIKYVYTHIYMCGFFFQQNNMTRPIRKKLTHIVYYKYQQRSLQR